MYEHEGAWVMPPKDKDKSTIPPYDNDTGLSMADAGEGVLTMGSLGDDISVNYDMGQLNFGYDNDLRNMYPALKQAYEHYQSILEICKTKEKEEDEN